MDRKYFFITPFILLSIAISIQAAETFTDDFNTPHDYLVDGVIYTGWDGFFGLGENETVDVLDANITNAPRDANLTGLLYIQSTGSNWDSFNPYGPFLYKIASDDFITEVEVVDIAGCYGSDWVGHNNACIMARVPNLDDAGPGEDYVAMCYFAAWCGHIGRSFDNGLKDEFGCSGGVCNEERFIQLQRSGNTFYFRTSTDGITWQWLEDDQGTGTLVRDDMAGLDLQAGLMHSVYSAETGYVAFDDFKLTADAFPQYLNAHTPFPQNGATEVDPYTNLRWKPGKYVQDVNGHEVYVSENFNDVNDANNSIKTVLTDANYVPDEGFFFINRNYYWRVDEVNDACSPYKWEGEVWSFETTCKALKPPFDNIALNVVNPLFLWIPCEYSITQDLYFSTDFEDVNSGSPNALLAADLPGDANDYPIPTPIYPGTTYYWKVDSNCGQLGFARGDVWEFTIPYLYTLCDDFEDDHDYFMGTDGTIWDGIVGWECLIYIGTDMNDGHLTIESMGCCWAGNSHGVLLYTDIAGDFAATVEISDFLGLYVDRGSAVPTNNAGIMARVSDLDLAGPGEDWISIDYFPGWGVGNIIRYCDDGFRYEIGYENTGWQANRYLQMERYGNTFHLSRSPDGVVYHPSLKSPVEREDFNGLDLQVGLHHSTCSGYMAWAEYDDFCVARNAIEKAYAPNPASGGMMDLMEGILSWTKGDFAVEHRVYFSSDFNDVNERVEDANRGTEEVVPVGGGRFSYDAGYYESLAIGQTYYWCIDEINDYDPCLWPGDVWRFTVQDYSPIDTFESYSGTGKVSTPPAGTLKSVWVDGNFGFRLYPETPATSGSLVQLNTDTHDGNPNYAHYQPEDIAQSDGKSMKFYYDNDGYVTWESDLYNCYVPGEPNPCNYIPFPDTYLSEAYAAIDDAAASFNLDSLDLKRDWSIYKVLKLSFYGDPNNGIEPMYIGLKDDDGTLVTLEYQDSSDIVEPWWHDWYVALSEFTDKDAGLDLTEIVRIYIGFGDKDNPVPGNTGLVFFDDILLFATPQCVPGSVLGDFDGDCMVNYSDLEIMTHQWLSLKPNTATFYADDTEPNQTTFINDANSNGVILVRTLLSNEFHIVPPGEQAIVFSNGTVSGSIPFEKFAAAVKDSNTIVEYEVTDVQDMNFCDGQVWRDIKVGDVLKTCMWYQRKTHFTSYLKVRDKKTGERLEMGIADVWFVIVAHHVPADPRFENVNKFADFTDFNYAPMDITGDKASVSGNGSYNPTSYQTGLRTKWGEAVVPQRFDTDIYVDGIVNFKDLAVLGNKWMQEPVLLGGD